MPRSTIHPSPASLSAGTQALRDFFSARRRTWAFIFGTALLTTACGIEESAPFNPPNLTVADIEDAADRRPGATASGLIPNTVQLIRLASDTTRCLYISDNVGKIGNPVLIGMCGSRGGKAIDFKFTSNGEIRNSANRCIGGYAERVKVGSPVAVIPCDGSPRTRWTYDAGMHLVNGIGACFTVSGATLTRAAKTHLGPCVSPAPWSQKVIWNTAGAPVVPGPAQPPTNTPPNTPPSPTVASVRISPSANTIGQGANIQLVPTAYNKSGQPVPATFTWSIASGPSIVTVSNTGMVKGLAAGTATIAAQAAGFTGTATVTVTSVSTPPPPTTTPPPSGPPPAGNVPSTPPSLPLSTVDVSWRAPTGKTIAVHAGDNLQKALNAAQRGDEIVIDAGATFTGNFLLPAKSGTSANGWITVRTSALSSLPPLGGRVSPQHAQYMPRIITPNALEAIGTAPGTSGWRLVGLDITVVPSLVWIQQGLVLLGDGGTGQNLMSEVPYDLILDRVFIHGQPQINLKRCVALNSARTAIVGSQLLECHGRGFDSQAIASWNGPGPYLIENNRLEAAGEVIIFGGSRPAINNLVPTDITVRRNYLYRPMNWKGQWTVKNLFELKNAQRVLVEGNVMENNWVDGQIGFAVVLGSADTDYPWCIVQDVLLRYNHIHNSAGGFNLFEHYGSALPMRRVAIHHNLLTDIGASGLGNNGRMFQMLDGIDDLWIEHNTGFAPTTYMTFSSLTKAKKRFAFRNNIGGGAVYNLHSSSAMGGAALNVHLAAPYLFAGNVFVGAVSPMPSGNTATSSLSALGFVNPAPVGGTWSLSAVSPFRSMGTGGITPGVEWAALANAIANVRN